MMTEHSHLIRIWRWFREITAKNLQRKRCEMRWIVQTDLFRALIILNV